MFTYFHRFCITFVFLLSIAFVFGQTFTGVTTIRAGTEIYRWDSAGQEAIPADWRVVDGDWQVHDGKLTGQTTGYGCLMFPASGQDMALEVEMATVRAGNPTRWAGIVGRWQAEPEKYISFTNRMARSAGNGLEIACFGEVPDSTSLWEVACLRSWKDGLADEAPRKLRLELIGLLARCFVNDKLALESLLPERMLGSGQLGIVLSNVKVNINSVRIESLSPLSPEEQEIIQEATVGYPLVIAHRGDSAEYPENTIPAIISAVEEGADAVEVDVRISKDGVPYLFHDNKLDRVTDGKGDVRELTWKQLQELTVTQSTTGRQARICTLEEAVIAIKQRNAILHIDLKEKNAVPAMIEILQRHEYAAKTIIGCGRDFELIKTFREALPEAKIVIITGSRHFSDQELTALRAAGVNGISIHTSNPQRLPFRQAKLHGMIVYNWTINNPETARRVWKQGVDAIVTDKPGLIRKILRQTPPANEP